MEVVTPLEHGINAGEDLIEAVTGLQQPGQGFAVAAGRRIGHRFPARKMLKHRLSGNFFALFNHINFINNNYR